MREFLEFYDVTAQSAVLHAAQLAFVENAWTAVFVWSLEQFVRHYLEYSVHDMECHVGSAPN